MYTDNMHIMLLSIVQFQLYYISLTDASLLFVQIIQSCFTDPDGN